MGKIRLEDYLEEDKEYNFRNTKHKKEKNRSYLDERWDDTY